MKHKAQELLTYISGLGKRYLVIYQFEREVLLSVFTWYIKRHVLFDEDPELILLYKSLVNFRFDDDSYIIPNIDNEKIIAILKEYIDEH